jgi:hypothetical protein
MDSREIFMIKRFLKARTPQLLELSMLKNNAERGAYHQYDIIFDGNNWFAWFLSDSRDLARPKGLDRKGDV